MIRHPAPVPSRRLAAVLAAGALAGCAAGPDFVRPAPPSATSFLQGGSTADAAALNAGMPARCPCDAASLPVDWWTLLGNPALDQLVERALKASPTVEAARATLARAQELRDAGAGVFLPQVGASLSDGRQKALTEAGGSPRALGPYNLATLGASVSYSLDVFGGHRRAVEALGAQVDRARADLRAARLALASNVATAVIARAGYLAQADALSELAGLQDEQVRLAESQYEAGVASYAPVLALETSRSGTAASIVLLRDRAAQARTLIARLCGEAPAEADIPDIALAALHLPVPPPLELPAAWAAHRPDIAGAEADLHAASAAIGVATANLLPDITLGGQDGRASGAIGKLLSSGTPFWSAQAAVAATLFDGGANLHARRAAIDAYDATVAQYRETVLVALEQVADTLQSLADDRELLRARARASDTAAEAVSLARAQWEAGVAGYLDMLTADAQLQSTRLDLVGTTAQQLQDAVVLYAALGGGWWDRAADGGVATER